jgi:uncharacterized protein with PIN domain
MKFIVDCMLGKLAKWLKILGFDTLYFSKIEDDELLAAAREQGRILLTRDTGLIEKAKGVDRLFLESEEWREQVRQVLETFDLWEEVDPHTRCIDCNIKLKDLAKKDAKNLVTPFVYQHADSFALCPSCGKVFWRGTHFKDMEFKIDEILKNKD